MKYNELENLVLRCLKRFNFGNPVKYLEVARMPRALESIAINAWLCCVDDDIDLAEIRHQMLYLREHGSLDLRTEESVGWTSGMPPKDGNFYKIRCNGVERCIKWSEVRRCYVDLSFCDFTPVASVEYGPLEKSSVKRVAQ